MEQQLERILAGLHVLCREMSEMKKELKNIKERVEPEVFALPEGWAYPEITLDMANAIVAGGSIYRAGIELDMTKGELINALSRIPHRHGELWVMSLSRALAGREIEVAHELALEADDFRELDILEKKSLNEGIVDLQEEEVWASLSLK
jgi:hypothetical protein